jgi:hypothetical protein
MVYIETGQTAEARAVLERALASDLQFTDRSLAEAALADLPRE